MEKGSFFKILEELNAYPDARLLAVSKTRTNEEIINLYQHGQIDFGENRVDELFEKANTIAEEIRWHFIGNLQTNKLNKLLKVKNLVSIHSVDRLKLVEAMLSREDLLDHQIDLYLQFNTSGEEEKSGFETEEELIKAIKLINKSTKYLFRGLMTMGKIRTVDPLTDARHCFSRLSSIKNSLIKDGYAEKLELSMGMSGDYKIALEEGAGVIRVGTALFQ